MIDMEKADYKFKSAGTSVLSVNGILVAYKKKMLAA